MKQMAKGLPLPPKGSEPENRTKLRKALRECRGYIEANRAFIPNYGVRGIGGKPGDQQADGEETANAVEQEGRAPDDVYRRSAEGRCLTSAHFFMLSKPWSPTPPTRTTCRIGTKTSSRSSGRPLARGIADCVRRPLPLAASGVDAGIQNCGTLQFNIPTELRASPG